MDDVKALMRRHYISYASYVIRDRAIPHLIDGLKPVQRRILHTLWKMHDGKRHKVANVAGQTMALHPHGDASIIDALVHLANKNYLLDRQGNFGNPLTGDPAAAARYIETRLTPLAYETLFNLALTPLMASYDGRQEEPIYLPAKIPLLLLQGAEGIAVGMSTHIFPHNFQEVIGAEIAYLEGRPYTLLPDFPTGGIMDASAYEEGKGKVRVRAKLEVTDAKTIVIREICPSTTTESLIRSIEAAAKRGKIKVDTIHDYTSQQVEIEIKFPRGHYAAEGVELLYAHTECEVVLQAHMVVIRDEMPCELDLPTLVACHAEQLQVYVKRELEIEHNRLAELLFAKTLEDIFMQERLYQLLETANSLSDMHIQLTEALSPYHDRLARQPTHEDRERLLAIPIRRLSRYDSEKCREEQQALQQAMAGIEKELTQVKRVAIRYLKGILKKYGSHYPRRTAIHSFQPLETLVKQKRASK